MPRFSSAGGAPPLRGGAAATAIGRYFSEAMSMTKRYLHVLLQHPLVGFVDLLDRDHLDVADDLRAAAQKSSISCVSAMPPMSEPAKSAAPQMRLKTAATGSG